MASSIRIGSFVRAIRGDNYEPRGKVIGGTGPMWLVRFENGYEKECHEDDLILQ